MIKMRKKLVFKTDFTRMSIRDYNYNKPLVDGS